MRPPARTHADDGRLPIRTRDGGDGRTRDGGDGRRYPIGFFLYLPDQVPVHMKVLYTRPVVELAESFKVARHFTLDDPEDLTEAWLEEQMGIVKK